MHDYDVPIYFLHFPATSKGKLVSRVMALANASTPGCDDDVQEDCVEFIIQRPASHRRFFSLEGSGLPCKKYNFGLRLI